MATERRKKDWPPPIPPRKKTSGGRGKWVDPLIVHDDIRFGITNYRSIEPGDPTAADETLPAASRERRRRRE